MSDERKRPIKRIKRNQSSQNNPINQQGNKDYSNFRRPAEQPAPANLESRKNFGLEEQGYEEYPDEKYYAGKSEGDNKKGKILAILIIALCLLGLILLLLMLPKSDEPDASDKVITIDDYEKKKIPIEPPIIEAPHIPDRTTTPVNDRFPKPIDTDDKIKTDPKDKPEYAEPTTKKGLATFEYIGYGANHCVSGSLHKVTIDGESLILDAGAFYGLDYLNVPPLPKDIHEGVSAVLLSHAHIDHIGRVLDLVNNGFTGKFYCSPPTKELMPIMLLMTSQIANFGEEKFFYSKKFRESDLKRGYNTKVHLHHDCDEADRIDPEDKEFITTSRNKLDKDNFFMCKSCAKRIVDKAMKQVVTKPNYEPFKPSPNLEVTFYNTAHMPGAIMGDIKSLKTGHSLIWTGDYGSGNSPFLADQDYPDIDPTWAMIEGTYPANVFSTDRADKNEFIEFIGKCLEEGKRIVIPAFVLDRSQQVLHELTRGIQEGHFKLRDKNMIKVFSPTIDAINDIYKYLFTKEEFTPYFSKDFMEFGPFDDIFTVSRNIESLDYGEIGVASSGMADFGYAYEMVKTWIGDPKTVFILVSYQAPDSVGGIILDAARKGLKTVNLEGVDYAIEAEITRKGSFSGHATIDQMSNFLSKYKNLQNTLVVHGDANIIPGLLEQHHKFLPNVNFVAPEGGKVYVFKSESKIPDVRVGDPLPKRDFPRRDPQEKIDLPGFDLTEIDKTKIKLISGNYLYLGNRPVSLLGINTPEPASRRLKPGASQEPWASQALDLVTNAIEKAQKVEMIRSDYEADTGKYFAYLICDGVNINAELVRKNLAYVYYGRFQKPAELEKYHNEVLEAEKTAKPEFEDPYRWRKKNER